MKGGAPNMCTDPTCIEHGHEDRHAAPTRDGAVRLQRTPGYACTRSRVLGCCIYYHITHFCSGSVSIYFFVGGSQFSSLFNVY